MSRDRRERVGQAAPPHKRGQRAKRTSAKSANSKLSAELLWSIVTATDEELLEYARNTRATTRITGIGEDTTSDPLLERHLSGFEETRKFVQWHGSTNRISLEPVFGELGIQLRWAESRGEAAVLNHLSHLSEVTAVASQGYLLTTTLPDAVEIEHTPDGAFDLASGQRCVYDKRSARAWDLNFAAKAQITAAWAQLHGMEYYVFDDMPQARRDNLAQLRLYARVLPQVAELADAMCAALTGPTSVHALIRQFGGYQIATAPLWHLIWCERIDIDLNRLVKSHSVVAPGPLLARDEEWIASAAAVCARLIDTRRHD